VDEYEEEEAADGELAGGHGDDGVAERREEVERSPSLSYLK
jgi:hypothetical protein